MILVRDWLNDIEKKHGAKVRNNAFDELKRWDNYANTQTFFNIEVLKMLLINALDK